MPADFGVTRQIMGLVWHDMEGYLPGAIAEWNKGNAGAHLCVLRNGTVVRTVRLEDAAWHAGTSATTGRTPYWRTHNANPYTIGVELEGFVSSGYTTAQAAACRRISDWCMARYPIPRRHSMDAMPGHHAHSDISNQRTDPGPLFDWAWVL